jgi:hypothetical protein
MFVDPFPAYDELVPEVSDVSDPTTEACEPELRKNAKNLERRAHLADRSFGFRNR